MQNNKKSQQIKQELLSIGEASDYLGVSIDTLRRWEKKGRITARRSPGGHRYFQKEDLNDLFDVKYTRDAKPKPYAKRSKEDEKKDPDKVAVAEKKERQTYAEPRFEKILDRPVREIKIPPIKPIAIRARQEEVSTGVQYRVSVAEVPTISKQQTVLQTQPKTPPALQGQQKEAVQAPVASTPPPQTASVQTTPQTSRQTQSILEAPTGIHTPQQETIKREGKSKNQKIVITTILSILLIAVILFFYWYSRPKILSPVP